MLNDELWMIDDLSRILGILVILLNVLYYSMSWLAYSHGYPVGWFSWALFRNVRYFKRLVRAEEKPLTKRLYQSLLYGFYLLSCSALIAFTLLVWRTIIIR